MKCTLLNLVGLLLVAGGFAAYGEYAVDFGNGKRLTMGVDARLRWEYYDREAYNGQTTPQSGPAVQYLRARERVWGKLELSPDSYFMARLVNRWQYFTSREGENNFGTATWEFPGEVIFDNLYFDWGKIADVEGLSLRIGRQDVILGNGMVVAEGTRLDAGRDIYFDGVVGTYETETDTLKLMALYNDMRDEYVLANDDERNLRDGDTYLFGAYWTHRFDPAFNTDLYYLFTKINDYNNVNLPGYNGNTEESNIPGIRIFGSPHKQIDYSLEWAHQFGQMENTASDTDISSDMVDARLTLKAPEDTCLDPKLLLEYTYFSGNDPASSDEDEGWQSTFNGYPIWREELSVWGIMPVAWWTNLHQYRAQLDLLLNPADDEGKNKLTFSTAYAILQSDVESSDGSAYGNLISAFLDYTVNKNMNVSLQAAQFYPGNYYASGSTTEWLRLETNIKF